MSRRPARRAAARLSVIAVGIALTAALSGCVPSLATPVPTPSPTGFAVPKAVAPDAPLVVPAAEKRKRPLAIRVFQEPGPTAPRPLPPAPARLQAADSPTAARQG